MQNAGTGTLEVILGIREDNPRQNAETEILGVILGTWGHKWQNAGAVILEVAVAYWS